MKGIAVTPSWPVEANRGRDRVLAAAKALEAMTDKQALSPLYKDSCTYALWTTMSTPYFIGFSRYGLANVESTTVHLSPCPSSPSQPSLPNSSRSSMDNSGLLGVSAYNSCQQQTCSWGRDSPFPLPVLLPPPAFLSPLHLLLLLPPSSPVLFPPVPFLSPPFDSILPLKSN